jgi:hypothetical protein
MNIKSWDVGTGATYFSRWLSLARRPKVNQFLNPDLGIGKGIAEDGGIRKEVIMAPVKAICSLDSSKKDIFANNNSWVSKSPA